MLEFKSKLRAPEITTFAQKNDFSVEVATRMTLDLLLRNRESDSAKDLLFFIGCFPKGIFDEHLEEMWSFADL